MRFFADKPVTRRTVLVQFEVLLRKIPAGAQQNILPEHSFHADETRVNCA